jgi:WD repeat-containing protein 45
MSDWLDPDSTIPLSTMLTANFNQDGSCLAIGLEDGFEVFSMPPFQKSISRKLGGSLGQLEMLFRCHLFALVGPRSDSTTSTCEILSSSNTLSPYSPPNRVLIWDDHNLKPTGELSYKSNYDVMRLLWHFEIEFMYIIFET